MARPLSSDYHLGVTLEERFEVNRPDVVDESVDGEVLIVHLGTGAYFSSRGAGDSAWQLLAAGLTPAESAAVLHQDADAVTAFAAQLVDEGLLRARATPPAPQPPVGVTAGPMTLDKYTDMQELLLLDPIHDVEPEGWPAARQGGDGN